jgi:hypothetical protein
MMPHGGNWGAPSVIAALAGSVHDGESTANYERNDNNDSYYGRRSLQPPLLRAKPSKRAGPG